LRSGKSDHKMFPSDRVNRTYSRHDRARKRTVLMSTAAMILVSNLGYGE
jgi:hypothetical protein